MSELVVEPWTNELGQVINPGDKVIFAGTSWKRTTIRRGVFAGVRYANITRTRFVKDAEGNIVMTERYGRPYPKEEYYSAREVVAIRVEKVSRGYKYDYIIDPETGKVVYVRTDKIRYGVSTLPLKRVYKIDTALDDLTGEAF